MDLRGKHVWVVGSSSVGEYGQGALGKALRARLQALGATVSFDGLSSRGLAADSANQLVGRPEQRDRFVAALHFVRPDLVLMIFGGNPSGNDTQLRDGMLFVRERVLGAGAELRWVGPPPYVNNYAQDISDRYDRIGPKVLGARYHSSQDWTDDLEGRTTPGYIHFTSAGGERWADHILAWVFEPARSTAHRTLAPWAVVLLSTLAVGTVAYLVRGRP